jgi:hypothetical protein
MEAAEASAPGLDLDQIRPSEAWELVLEYKIIGKLNFVTAETHAKRLRSVKEPSLTILINMSQVCMQACVHICVNLCFLHVTLCTFTADHHAHFRAHAHDI